MDVEKVETGGGAPVSEEARFDVIECQRTFKERIVFEVDLADGEVVGGAPVGVDQSEFGWIERGIRRGCRTRHRLLSHGFAAAA
jgi:hypothetical protein